MKRATAVFASTHVDRQGDCVTNQALQTMADQLSRHYVVVHMHHDPRVVPIGRVTSAQVVPDGDTGEYKLLGEIDLWEPGDTPASLAGDGRTICAQSEANLTIALDRGPIQSDLANDLRDILGSTGSLRYRVKKSADVGETILISVGVFTILQFMGGFLEAAGADTYAGIKRVLKRWVRRPKLPESFEFCIGVVVGTRTVDVHCFVFHPLEDEIESFFSLGLSSVADVVSHILTGEPRVARVFIQWQNAAWALHYWIHDDGVPSRIEPVPVDVIANMGLSLGAIVSPDDIADSMDAS